VNSTPALQQVYSSEPVSPLSGLVFKIKIETGVSAGFFKWFAMFFPPLSNQDQFLHRYVSTLTIYIIHEKVHFVCREGKLIFVRIP
jgi:hypothetical protein